MQNMNLERRLLSQEACCSTLLPLSAVNQRVLRDQHCPPYRHARGRIYLLDSTRNKRRKISITRAAYADELPLPYVVRDYQLSPRTCHINRPKTNWLLRTAGSSLFCGPIRSSIQIFVAEGIKSSIISEYLCRSKSTQPWETRPIGA